MSDPQIPLSNPNRKPSSEAEPPKIPSRGGGGHGPSNFNPRETAIPGAATLRDQWRFAVRHSSKAEPPKIPNRGGGGHGPSNFNPRETAVPDAATLRDQWRFAVRQYSRWYSQAWGTAILAGVSFFALGWVIKGSNPLPSSQSDNTAGKSSSPAAAADEEKALHRPR